MRLIQIMKNKPNPGKPRWRAALLLTTMAAGSLGLISAQAASNDEIKYVKRVGPIMPTSCPGIDLNTIKIEGKERIINGEASYMHTAQVGSVQLKFDARADGVTENIRIIKSNASCFDSPAQASVAQWIVETSGHEHKDIEVLIIFLLTGEEHEDIDGPLNKFLGGG